MKTNKALVWVAIGGLVALGGCGKSEEAAAPAQDKAKTEAVAAPKAAQQASGAAVDAAKATEQPASGAAVDVAKAKAAEAVAAKMVEPAPTPPATDAGAGKVEAVGAAPATAAGLVGQATGLSVLSQDQMVEGLREALGKGLQKAVAGLGHDGGFLSNAKVKIPMPEKMQKVESALRAMKQEKLADDFVATMNHAAEQAVPEAAGVFADALKQMTIADGKSILSGGEDAATQYFQKTTQSNLYAKFLPIVQKATEKAGVTGAYKKVMAKVNVSAISDKLGGLGSALGSSGSGADSMDIDAYVTNKAMEGLFKMVAEEEKQIRQNPVARTTDLLQKVFGAVSK